MILTMYLIFDELLALLGAVDTNAQLNVVPLLTILIGFIGRGVRGTPPTFFLRHYGTSFARNRTIRFSIYDKAI